MGRRNSAHATRRLASPALARLKTENLRSKAHAAIRASIVTGELEAGGLYSVSYFASRLGVSATPVREALFDLAHEGLVETVRNRGFRIPLLDDHDLDEIFEIRVLLEVPSMRRLADVVDDATMRKGRHHALRTVECARRNDLVGFLQNDRAFHECLLRTLGNRRLVSVISRLRDAVRLYGLAGIVGSPALVATAKEHLELLDALVQHDASRVERLMMRHLEHTRGIWAGRAETPPRIDRTGKVSSGTARGEGRHR